VVGYRQLMSGPTVEGAPALHFQRRNGIEISHNDAQEIGVATGDRVEITCLDRGPVVRAEACADDPYAALDVALAKLTERLRRMRDRKRVHRGRHAPEGLSEALSEASARVDPPLAALNGAVAPISAESAEPAYDEGESPVVIREKTHAARPMSLDPALYEMELVGHDFFLFVDAEGGVE